MELKRPRTKEVFKKVYDVLVEHAGAMEANCEDFIYAVVRWSERNPYQTNEYRFMGRLGMGGKFWLTPESFHVSAYSEDITPKRRAIITKTNAELKKLFVPPEVENEDT